MNHKKYIITWLIGLLVVAGLAFFLMHGEQLPSRINSPVVSPHGNSEQDIFSYAPASFDQFIYIQVGDEMEDALANMQWVQYGSGLQQLAERVEQLLITQLSTDTQVHSLLFLEGDEIDIDELQQLGLITWWEEFRTEQLSDRIWMYGPQETFDRYSMNKKWLRDQELVDDFLRQFQAGNYNIGFVSTPLSQEGLPVVQQFSQQLEHSIFMTRLSPEATIGNLSLQFTDGVINANDTTFSPLLSSYASQESIVYLEMQDILWFFGIEKEQFLGLLPVLLGQYGSAYGALLSQDDYATLYDSLEKNIALVVEPSTTSMLGMSVHLVFAHADMYGVLSGLGPLWKSTIEWFLGTGSVQETTTETSVSYTASNPLLTAGEAMVVASMQQQDGATVLSIFGDVLAPSGQEISLPVYDDDTSMVFMVDNTKLQELNSYQPLVGEVDLAGASTNAFQQWIILGDIQADAERNQIVVSFKVEQ